jgi:translation initiation factor IF-1
LVERPNGHWVYGVIKKKTKIELSGLKTGDKVAIFFSPADMARGIILRKLEC